MKEETWSKFWMEEENSFQVMRISTSVFAKRLQRLFGINSSHRILDYGSGPGFLIDYFSDKGIESSGLDINAHFVDMCSANHPSLKFVLISPDSDKTKPILENNFSSKRFDFIVILSVLQYFESEEHAEKLIDTLKIYLTDHGRIVIADVIDLKTSSLIDGLALLWHCFLAGNFIELVTFIRHNLFSNYGSISKRLKLKIFSDEAIQRIASNCSMKAVKTEQLTMHPTRSNYILTQ